MSEASPRNDAPRPVFVYGTLMAPSLLAWLLTGSSSNSDRVLAQRKPGHVDGFTRHSVLGCDYPALVKTSLEKNVLAEADSSVKGFLVFPKNLSEWKKLDDFEGEVYTRTPVAVVLDDADKEGTQVVQADTYVWDGPTDRLGDQDWSFEYFVRERLEDWLELFSGMEMIG